MSNSLTFIDDVLSGSRLAFEIDDAVAAWHAGDSDLSLREALGLRPDEYDLWLSSPDFLELIIYARVSKTPLVEVANDNFVEKQRIAARAEDTWMIKQLRDWLSKYENE
jgi:hypothetical protein